MEEHTCIFMKLYLVKITLMTIMMTMMVVVVVVVVVT